MIEGGRKAWTKACSMEGDKKFQESILEMVLRWRHEIPKRCGRAGEEDVDWVAQEGQTGRGPEGRSMKNDIKLGRNSKVEGEGVAL